MGRKWVGSFEETVFGSRILVLWTNLVGFMPLVTSSMLYKTAFAINDLDYAGIIVLG